MRWPVSAIIFCAIAVLLSACGQDVDFRSLLDDLTNGSDEKQYDAAIELGNRKETRAVEAMTHIIEDDDPLVREAVARALGEIGDPAAIDALGRAATLDENVVVREAAVYSLGQIGDPSAIGILIKILGGEEPPNIEVFEAGREEPNEALLAAFSLRRIGVASISSLTEATRSGDIAVRRVAIATLGDIGLDSGDYSAVPLLLTTLSDPDDLVRETTAHALIITGDPSSLESLVAALDAGGTERMAGLFINSGQQQLVDAATEWIAAKGLDRDSVRCSVNGRAKWGAYDTTSEIEGC